LESDKRVKNAEGGKRSARERMEGV
jgi:hypothetical protein